MVTIGVHDITIINLTAIPTSPSVGQHAFINVMVKNQGDYTENLNVSIYYTWISDP
jgi:hypothetical protein